MTFRWTQILMLCGALAMGACGDDDGGGTDTNTQDTNAADTNTQDTNAVDAPATDTNGDDVVAQDTGVDAAEDTNTPACEDLAPTQGADNVIISQIDLGTGEIEFFNPTSAAIDVSAIQLCAQPGYNAPGAVTVEPGAYATTTLGGVAGQVSNAMGEMALYTSGPFGDRANMFDFVCWGGARTPSRKGLAEMELNGVALWAGDCMPASDGVIIRTAGTAGASAADYTTAAARVNRCP